MNIWLNECSVVNLVENICVWLDDSFIWLVDRLFDKVDSSAAVSLVP
jgi:hypothetical protein